MKVLYVATVRSHIGQFHMPVIKALKDSGHIVHAAFKDNSIDKPGLDLSILDKTFNVPFARSPYSTDNVSAYKRLKEIIDTGEYDIIHCHTPVGGVVTRLAAMDARKKGTKVFYTAHGFHFYKGASKLNWALFFPVEKMLSGYTDTLITINKEDYDNAVNHHFKANRIVKINGVGVDLSKFHIVDNQRKEQIRKSLSISDDTFVMLYAADLSKRKNQPMIFDSLAKLSERNRKILLLCPGQPILKDEYVQKCNELGISEMVEFMGYRRDIDQLLAACDCVISSSRQEGLPLNLIEAAASGKYIIATDVRGNADVVAQSGYGELVALNDSDAMAKAIYKRINSKDEMPQSAHQRVAVYDEKQIVHEVMKLYQSA